MAAKDFEECLEDANALLASTPESGKQRISSEAEEKGERVIVPKVIEEPLLVQDSTLFSTSTPNSFHTRMRGSNGFVFFDVRLGGFDSR